MSGVKKLKPLGQKPELRKSVRTTRQTFARQALSQIRDITSGLRTNATPKKTQPVDEAHTSSMHEGSEAHDMEEEEVIVEVHENPAKPVTMEDIEVKLDALMQSLEMIQRGAKPKKSGIPIRTQNPPKQSAPSINPAHTSQTTPESHEELIKYVLGPKGQLIPVYGTPPPPPPPNPPPEDKNPSEKTNPSHSVTATEPNTVKYPDDLNSLNIPILTFDLDKKNEHGKVYTNNIEMWVQQVERETIGFKPLNICRAAHKHSEGKAWFKLGHLIDMCKGEWSAIKPKLQATAYDLFTDGYNAVINSIMSIKRDKGENVTSLHEKFRPYREKVQQKYPQFAETAEKLMIQTFTGLINKRLQLQFNDSNKASFDEVYYIALEFDKHNPRSCPLHDKEEEKVTINAVSAEKYDSDHKSKGAGKPFCNYCKTPGHVISECRKRQYNNNRHRGRGRGWHGNGRNKEEDQKYAYGRGRGYHRGGNRGKYNNRGRNHRGGYQNQGSQHDYNKGYYDVDERTAYNTAYNAASGYPAHVPPYPYPPPNYPHHHVCQVDEGKKTILKKKKSKDNVKFDKGDYMSDSEFEDAYASDSKNE